MRRFTPLLLSLCFLWSIRPALAGQTEWVLSQKHSEFGRYTVYVANDAIKIVNQSGGYEVVAKAPTWKVVIYRPLEKQGCDMELKQFCHSDVFGLMGGSRKLEKFPLRKLETKEVDGIKICKYKAVYGFEEIWTTETFACAQPAIDIAEACYRLNSTPGFPLRNVAYHKPYSNIPSNSWMSGGINVSQQGLIEPLKSYSWKKVPYNTSDFTYPTGYKRAKNVQQLVFALSGKNKNSLEDLAKDMGIGEEFGSQKK